MSESTGPQALTPPGPEPQPDAPGGTLLDRLFEDQRKRWMTGERPPASSYLERYAALRADPDTAADLVYNEYLLRTEMGERPAFDEYLAGYPQYADDLRMLHEANRGMEEVGLLSGIEKATGEEFGDYCLLEEIGRGGMGVVYRARQKSLKRVVALKMLRDGEWSDDEEKIRFLQEAEAAAALEHPNIVAVHEVGDGAGRLYFSMDHVEGTSLAQMVQERPLPPKDAARYVEAIARAVHFAHQHGVIHRDLKPSNVLVDRAFDRPRVTDFGLAKRTEADTRLTGSGQILGTPSYMSPEQASGNKATVGPRADVYSLGATLYELLTGRPPFRAETVFETLRQVLEAEPAAPRVVNPGVPRDLETICLKCLRKEPARRYASAEELAEDLRCYLVGRPIKARPVPPWERAWKWCRRRPAAAALLTILAVGVPCGLVGGWKYDADVRDYRAQVTLGDAKRAAQAERLRAEMDKAATSRYHSLVNKVAEAVATPRPGWTIAALADLEEAARIPTEAREPLQLRRLAASCLAAIDVRPRDEFARGMNAYNLTFSPDGKRLAVGEYKGVPLCSIEIIDLESRKARKFSWLTFRQNQTGVRALAFSPDGRWLVAGMRGGEIFRWDTAEANPQPTVLRAHKSPVSGLAFRHDGRLLVSSSEDGTLGRWEVAGWKELPSISLGTSLTGVEFSPDDSLLACLGSGGLSFYDPEALFAPRPTLKPSWRVAYAQGPFRFSPDGRQVACREHGRMHLYQVHPYGATGEHPFRNLSDEDSHAGGLTRLDFHPDGSLLVSAGNDRKLILWDVASGRQLLTLVPATKGRVYPAFHPSGRSLAVTADDITLTFDLTGLREQTLLAHHNVSVRAFAYSPDGAGLACTAANDPRTTDDYLGEVTRWRRDGTFQERKEYATHTDEGGRSAFCLAYHPGGRSLVYTDATGQGFLIWDAGREAVRSPVRARGIASLQFTSDGAALWAAFDPARVALWPWPGPGPPAEWKNSGAIQVKSQVDLKSVASGHDWLLAGSADATTKLFRRHQGNQFVKEVEWESPEKSQVLCVALSKDEALAASGTQSGAVQVVRVPGGAAFGPTLRGHQEDVQSVAFSPGGDYLATGSRDRTVRLWQRADAEFREVIVLPVPGPVTQVEFSPDGTQLSVLVQKECAVRVWHLPRLRESLGKLGLDW